MALRSAGSPNGSQPILSSDSEHHRESVRQDTEEPKRCIGPIGQVMVFATIEAAVAFVMGFTCTKVYLSSAPYIGITGFFKKTIFLVFVLCNSITMMASVVAVLLLTCAKVTVLIPKALLFLGGMSLVKIAFDSILVAFVVGVCFVLVLLPWHTYFT